MWATCSCCWRLECTSPRGFVLRDGTERTFFKSSADRGGHCTSNVATLPSTSSISLLLLGRSALFSSFAFLLGLLFPPPPHNHTSFPTLALSPHIHSRNRQMRRGTNASFFIRLHLTWRFTCLSESKTIQLHYLSVKHAAAAARPAAGNEVFLHCWGG